MSFKVDDQVCVRDGSWSLAIDNGKISSFNGLQLQNRIFVVRAVGGKYPSSAGCGPIYENHRNNIRL